MVDLKDHVMARHRSKIELMPNSFLTENNGLWMANYPEVYARVISPSNENSVQARIEVLEFLTKANHTARTKEQCILGWKCSKELIKGTAEDDVSETQPRIYSPTRPNIYEDMELRNITIGLGICSAIFQLNLGLTIRDYKVTMKDAILKEPRMLEALIRTMTSLTGVTYTGVKPFDSEIVGELKTTISQIIAKKVSIKQDVIEDIKTAEELFPVRTELEPTTILSTLRTPSTSGILLDYDVGNEYEKRTKHKHTDKTEEKIERKRRRKDEGGHKGNENESLQERVRMEIEARKQDKERSQEEEMRKQEEVRLGSERERIEQATIVEEERLRREGERMQQEKTKEEEERITKKFERIRQEEILRKELKRIQQEERLRKEREAIQQETTKEEERLRKEREIIQQEIAKEKEKLVEVEQRRNDEDVNGQEDVGERKKDRTGKLATGHGNAIPYVAARMDDSQESWREDLDTRNDMGQEFSNEETDVRGEIRTPRERATELMRKGGMPLFPGGRREWDKERIITLFTIPTTLKWPPTNWKSISADQKYFNWEFASIALELNAGNQLQLSKEELLLKYHFLALPGTKAPTMKEDNTIMIKSRFYLHNAIKQIIKTNREDHTTIIFLNMLEATNDKREETSDLCRKIDEAGIGLRLGDE